LHDRANSRKRDAFGTSNTSERSLFETANAAGPPGDDTLNGCLARCGILAFSARASAPDAMANKARIDRALGLLERCTVPTIAGD
jgi:hypothetical protein